MHDKIIVLDFGSQYTQLIARRIRELNVFCEITPFNKIPELTDDIKGIILSGSPFSVEQEGAPQVDLGPVLNRRPVLGICYGAQYMAKRLGGRVEASKTREYGRAFLKEFALQDDLLKNIEENTQVWMSHGDTIFTLPDDFEVIAGTDTVQLAAYKGKKGAFEKPVYGIQFHPEVVHTVEGKQLLKNFVVNICGCRQDWTPASFVEETVEKLKQQIGNDRVIMGLSGGVDSTVAATLIDHAIGERLHCFFINNGLLRKNEFEEVLEAYKELGLNVTGVDTEERFLSELEGVSDPEQKRKIIGRLFVEVFEEESKKIKDAKWLGQGTIYPDVIESVSVHGPSVTIKSHHNVGGLPEKMNLKVVEPLNTLFKDEVRKAGKELGLGERFLGRHPFPGPGLAIRILGALNKEKIRILQEADAIFTKNLKQSGLYDEVWQSAVILLPVQSVGVMGDERTYEFVVALRAVSSMDGMTADWSRLPDDFLAKVSNEIINNVKGINRVVYDISSKPPATIEWE